MTTIFETLRDDHQTQRRLIELVSKTHGDSDGRHELFSHAAVEERVFYAVLLGDELTRDKAGHSVKEHHQIESLFEELADRTMEDGGWLLRFQTLADKLLHHMDEEEQEVFQMGGKLLDEQQKLDLSRQFLAEKPAQRAEERAS